MKAKLKFFLNWSWILFVLFMILSIFDIRFAILGLTCMISPIFFASIGKGKIHCSYYCPRGSFLGRFLDKFSIGYNVPHFMQKTKFKNLILILMISVFSISLYKGGLSLQNIGITLFKIILITTIIGIILGIFYKPRVWCTICPMGHASFLIDRRLRNKR